MPLAATMAFLHDNLDLVLQFTRRQENSDGEMSLLSKGGQA